MQWRALLGALLMLIIYVLNWNFYVFGLQLLTSSTLTSEWVTKWVLCLDDQGSQSICANLTKEYMPSYSYIITLLFFNRTAGILIFIIFAAKKSVLLEIYDLIRGKHPRDMNPNLSFLDTEVSGVHSIRDSVSAHRLNRLSFYVNNNNKNDDDNVSNTIESATLAPSERTSVSMMENNMNKNERRSETSITFSHISPSRRYSVPMSTSLRDSIQMLSTLPEQSILRN